MNLKGWSGGFRRLVSAPEQSSSRRPDDRDDGLGVPVVAGPRPRRGGAQARPPEPEREDELVGLNG
ncbi:hypothetical protein [Deinococcus petrolearius]|uniref:Uncharacterized protein n=1 Tax=Deinococcus petrolearius TaxID=1751295 RepID=A0ABW1DRS6_9DEIO